MCLIKAIHRTGTYQFQVGANADQTVDLTIDNYSTAGAGAAHLRLHQRQRAVDPVQQRLRKLARLTFAGTFAEGDKIAVSVGDKSVVHTVTAAKAGSTAATDQQLIAQAIKTALGTITGGGTVTGTAAA